MICLQNKQMNLSSMKEKPHFIYHLDILEKAHFNILPQIHDTPFDILERWQKISYAVKLPSFQRVKKSHSLESSFEFNSGLRSRVKIINKLGSIHPALDLRVLVISLTQKSSNSKATMAIIYFTCIILPCNLFFIFSLLCFQVVHVLIGW